MKIKLYSIIHGKPYGNYNLAYSGDEVKVENIIDIVKQAKRHFKIAGKQFILRGSDTVFFATKIGKEWLAYELTGVEEDESNNDTGSEENDEPARSD